MNSIYQQLQHSNLFMVYFKLPGYLEAEQPQSMTFSPPCFGKGLFFVILCLFIFLVPKSSLSLLDSTGIFLKFSELPLILLLNCTLIQTYGRTWSDVENNMVVLKGVFAASLTNFCPGCPSVWKGTVVHFSLLFLFSDTCQFCCIFFFEIFEDF